MTSNKSLRFALGAFLLAHTLSLSTFAGPSQRGDGKRVQEEGPDAAKLWAQTCSHCHNLRPAKAYSDAQWDVIVHHMRVRGNITGADARAIVDFLKSGN